MAEHEVAKSFQDLLVWQKAHQFVLEVYRSTENFPSKETHGLTPQFRRAAVSIPANIAEGSLQECTYYLILQKISDMPRIFNYSISLMRLEKCSMSIHIAFYLPTPKFYIQKGSY